MAEQPIPASFLEAASVLETLDRLEGHKLLNRDYLVSVITFLRRFSALTLPKEED